MAASRCSASWGFLFPGLSQFCLGQDGKAAFLAAVGAAELGTSIAVAESDPDGNGVTDFGHPGASIPALAFQDTWIYGLADGFLTRALASRALYAPRDRLADLAAAPFNLEVLGRPAVWAGILGSVAVGVGASILASGGVETERFGDDPNLFGRAFSPGAGYPLAVAAGVGLYSHVAIGEETLFRGALQSSLARGYGETGGWIGGSLLFGLAHAPNAFALDPSDRKEYLLVGLPVITALGTYLGWIYRSEGYSLAPPVALHFWYDFLLSGTFFVIDPENNPFSAGITIPF